MTVGSKTPGSGSAVDGLITYFSILARPRVAFLHLRETFTWGWAACAGTAMSLVATNLNAKAQLHLLALSNQQRIATTPVEHQAQVKAAIAQAAGFSKFFLLAGATAGPWLWWLIVAIVFVICAAIVGGQVRFGAAWVAALNSYIVYAVSAVINALIVWMGDPNAVTSPTDLLRVPNLGQFVHQDPQLAAFLTAYSVLNIWYYVIVAIALEQMLKLPRIGAIITTALFSGLLGAVTAATARPAP